MPIPTVRPRAEAAMPANSEKHSVSDLAQKIPPQSYGLSPTHLPF